MNTLSEYFAWYDETKEEFLRDLKQFLSFPSISTDPERKKDVLACANWVEQYAKDSGFKTEQWETIGHPTVYGEWLKAGSGKPTVLIYGHYDVQPADPLELWESPPFEPTLRDGNLFARGVSDNKGQIFYTLAALRSILKKTGSLPVNVKLCIEGEEESGSGGLAGILASRTEQLKADHLFVIDLIIHDPKVPAVCVGLRGITTLSVEFIGSAIDLHSGGHGGVAYNPNRAATEILSKFYDEFGKVAIPGFYDDVVPFPDDERKRVSLQLDPAMYKKLFGAEATGGEREVPPAERNTIRPALEINGFGGGYFGSGFKTVIPAKTTIKVSARTVPNQNPHKIQKLIADFIEANTPPGIRCSIELMDSGDGIRVRSDTKGVQSVARAMSEVLNAECRFVLEGGSIPIAAKLKEACGGDIALFGYGLPTDRWHAPNEHIALDRLRNGFVTVVRVLEILSEK